MSATSPLLALHERGGAGFVTYGPPDGGVRVPSGYAELELEYAAIRKSAGLMDEPQRGTVEITGPDRLEFLNRMVTQELKGMAAGEVRASFWLSRKGRIDADLRLVELGDRMLADVDIHAAARAVKGLAAYIITEDVAVTDASGAWHRLAMHGPRAPEVFARVAGVEAPGAMRALTARVAGADVVCFRDDACGVPGLELMVAAGQAEAVYLALLAFAHDHDAAAGPRPVGWHAFNIARIEAGTPLYNIDFGVDSLPHESGVLRTRVSFKKGCYLGQEIVARMESRGHSKRTLVRLACDAADGGVPLDAPQPVSGSRVFLREGAEEPIGEVTSSTPSPMHSLATICFASVKPAAAAEGTRVLVEAEGGRVGATVGRLGHNPSPRG
ncbi:MAG: aminomethyl transferase family protein [Phycisphaerales bacterium]|nr:aminomethyl transferase family protein [Phycisphaerales bacterium]